MLFEYAVRNPQWVKKILKKKYNQRNCRNTSQEKSQTKLQYSKAQIFQFSAKQREGVKLEYENNNNDDRRKQIRKVIARQVGFILIFLKNQNFYSAQSIQELFYLSFILFEQYRSIFKEKMPFWIKKPKFHFTNVKMKWFGISEMKHFISERSKWYVLTFFKFVPSFVLTRTINQIQPWLVSGPFKLNFLSELLVIR